MAKRLDVAPEVLSAELERAAAAPPPRAGPAHPAPSPRRRRGARRARVRGPVGPRRRRPRAARSFPQLADGRARRSTSSPCSRAPPRRAGARSPGGLARGRRTSRPALEAHLDAKAWPTCGTCSAPPGRRRKLPSGRCAGPCCIARLTLLEQEHDRLTAARHARGYAGAAGPRGGADRDVAPPRQREEATRRTGARMKTALAEDSQEVQRAVPPARVKNAPTPEQRKERLSMTTSKSHAAAKKPHKTVRPAAKAKAERPDKERSAKAVKSARPAREARAAHDKKHAKSARPARAARSRPRSSPRSRTGRPSEAPRWRRRRRRPRKRRPESARRAEARVAARRGSG